MNIILVTWMVVAAVQAAPTAIGELSQAPSPVIDLKGKPLDDLSAEQLRPSLQVEMPHNLKRDSSYDTASEGVQRRFFLPSFGGYRGGSNGGFAKTASIGHYRDFGSNSFGIHHGGALGLPIGFGPVIGNSFSGPFHV